MNKREKIKHFEILIKEKQTQIIDYINRFNPKLMVEGSYVHKQYIELLKEMKEIQDKHYQAMQEAYKVQFKPENEELEISKWEE